MINSFIENNEHLFGSLKYSIHDNEVVISPHKKIKDIHLSMDQLNTLANKQLVCDISNIKYHSNYGFSLEDYGEFFIGSDSTTAYDIYGGIDYIDIKFRIGKSYLEFSRVSDLCSLLLEPYFSKKAYYIEDRGLKEYYYTLKIFNVEQNLHKDLVLKALFYINSLFLNGIERKYGIIQVLPEGYDESTLCNNESEYELSLESRNLKTKDLMHVEPLYLYNDACIQSPSNQFLGFYRVIEFFFDRGVESTLKIMRKDAKISENEIINYVRGKDEKKLLRGLLDYALSDEEKFTITDFAFKNKIIDKIKFEKVSEKIYEYRCAIAHAKESHKDSIILPDIFFENHDRKIWTDIAKMLAEIVINKLNLK